MCSDFQQCQLFKSSRLPFCALSLHPGLQILGRSPGRYNRPRLVPVSSRISRGIRPQTHLLIFAPLAPLQARCVCTYPPVFAMDFLKSAVASAIAKGSSFPCSLGERVDIGDSIWTLHNATKRVRGSRCFLHPKWNQPCWTLELMVLLFKKKKTLAVY